MSARITNIMGMCETTGTLISGLDHVKQSLSRIVLTRLGTRTQRRNFGADILPLISSPGNEATRIKAIAIIAKAILKWEPRVKISDIQITVGFDGVCLITLNCSYEGQSLSHQVAVSTPQKLAA